MAGDSQLTASQSPFELVIFSNADNVRYYDAAYDAAKNQQLPFKAIHRTHDDAHIAAAWQKLLTKIESEWVFRIDADVALHENATTKLMAHLGNPAIAAFRCGVDNELLGSKFVEAVGSPRALVFRTEALRFAVDKFLGVPVFDMTALLKLAQLQTIQLYNRTRDINQKTPGAIGKDKLSRLSLGKNVAEWQPGYTFRWCYRLGAHLSGIGAEDIGTLVESMVEKKHPHWQLGVAAFVQGFLSGAGPEVMTQTGEFEGLFERARGLADRGVPSVERRIKLV